MNIKLLQSGINVHEIYWAIQSNPDLWNEYTARTEDKNSPHHGLDDIWCRFGSESDAKDGAAHKSKWYPSAEVLGIKKLCLDILHLAGGTELGGVLITRIPPGMKCKPHTDDGWHAREYEKFAVQITSAPGQKFCFDGESLETKPGDLFWFCNQSIHWVENPTDYERVTLIICIRREY